MHPAEAAEALQGLAALGAHEIHEGVEDGSGMGLHRDPVLRPDGMAVEGSEQGDRGGAARLMAAHLQPVAIGPQMIGVMDHPGGEPESAAFQGLQGGDGIGLTHGAREAGDGGCHGPDYSLGRPMVDCEDGAPDGLCDWRIA